MIELVVGLLAARRLFRRVKEPEHTLAKALALYLSLHEEGQNPKFIYDNDVSD
jgi:hypothetical protein